MMIAKPFRAACAALILISLMLCAGCGSHEAKPVSTDVVKKELLDKVWQCESIFERPVFGEKPPTIEFKADGTAAGFGSCNNYSGTYTLTGEAVSFGPMISTKKACGGALGEQEYTFLTMLAKVDRLKVDGDELELFIPDRSMPMVFSASGGGLW